MFYMYADFQKILKLETFFFLENVENYSEAWKREIVL
jgi:hypothetical protein